MVSKKTCLGILVTVLVFGMTVVGCNTGSNNPFDGTSWTMRADNSTLNFYGSTWEWFEHSMGNQGGGTSVYDFKGNYTHSGNTATLISTHYRTSGTWVSFTVQWTVTLDGNDISWVYDGGPGSRMVLDQIGENRGYGKMKQ